MGQRKRTGMRTGIEAKVTMRLARRAKRKAANRQKVRSGQEVVVALRRKTPGTQVATAVDLRRKRGKARALIRASENKKARCPAVAAVLTRRNRKPRARKRAVQRAAAVAAVAATPASRRAAVRRQARRRRRKWRIKTRNIKRRVVSAATTVAVAAKVRPIP